MGRAQELYLFFTVFARYHQVTPKETKASLHLDFTYKSGQDFTAFLHYRKIYGNLYINML